MVRTVLDPILWCLSGILAVGCEAAVAASTVSEGSVFIHTGGGDPSLGSRLADFLTQNGLRVRGVDNFQDSVGGAGVDYFNKADSDLAARASNLTNYFLGTDTLPLQPRFQSAVQNPPGYLGVWLFDPAPAGWEAKPPLHAWCYQEHNKSGYFVACHFIKRTCDIARGKNNPTPGSDCQELDLSKAQWTPHSGGYLRSWYDQRDTKFEPPFPNVP